MTATADLLRDLRAATGGKPRIYVPGGPAEPGCIATTLRDEPDLADGATFIGHWLPGINRTAWTGFHPGSRAEGTFLYSEYRSAFEDGRYHLTPIHYSGAYEWLKTVPLDAAFIPVSAPDKRGDVSLSLGTDMSPAVMARGKVRRIAVIRPDMPFPATSPRLPLSDFADVIEDDTPLITLGDPPLPDEAKAIAANVATLLGDGFTVQSGIGSVQQIAMAAAAHHRNIRIHTGMITDAALEAVNSGAISSAPGSILTGTAIGTPPLYEAAGSDPRFNFQPVSVTHSVPVLAAIPRLAAINGGVEVDLFGQLNSEWVKGRQVASTGGLGNFVRGAQLSAGGRSIIALPATARGGSLSRIVLQLTSPTVTLSRAEAGYVVTEHGVADLATADVDQRAERLIAVAAPAFRDSLANDWARLRASL
ncbi:acetyl-CoA hydrolase/transferase family protein [Hyphomonas jannaschiana]|uniref:Putative 4-hydroxybutyrate coenzyme A transferase n=1 Tax=Hyphomonas jannaschiana VP2 TaxID=1280952 RepID=A0A059FIJ4_9PROT|nr:acetyl-CoA hydrolase/transferase C-terminal domain-containing protein [Hyphomonas jannaschiana]KCZ90449.1 putative 4-hydroxybutyrate coenzyme A transferase [Hyphomonas jannaschiana VP2]